MPRCSAMEPLASGMYRCIYEYKDGHTEHYFNYYRALTTEERERFFPQETYEATHLARPADPLGPRSAERHDRVYGLPHSNERQWLHSLYERYESTMRRVDED